MREHCRTDGLLQVAVHHDHQPQLAWAWPDPSAFVCQQPWSPADIVCFNEVVLATGSASLVCSRAGLTDAASVAWSAACIRLRFRSTHSWPCCCQQHCQQPCQDQLCPFLVLPSLLRRDCMLERPMCRRTADLPGQAAAAEAAPQNRRSDCTAHFLACTGGTLHGSCAADMNTMQKCQAHRGCNLAVLAAQTRQGQAYSTEAASV